MPDQTPADTLTAAAKLLRERATADYVTPGPWIVHEANGFLRVDQPGPPSKAWTVKTGADLAEENRGTAEYIALMHPGVGIALVPWLEETAEFLLGVEKTHGVVTETALHNSRHALAVARQLLGEVTQ